MTEWEPDWQPISTLPRGRIVLVAPENPDGSLSVEVLLAREGDGLLIKTGHGGTYFGTPAHWSNLPEDEAPWRAIGEAPKDGTVIMARCRNTGTTGLLKWIKDRAGYFGAHDFGALAGPPPERWNFDRWMPRPSCPEIQGPRTDG